MKKVVHTRKISIQTMDLGDHTILVEGGLIDHRYLAVQGRESKESELVHHMVIQLKVKGPGMLIEQAEATMPHHHPTHLFAYFFIESFTHRTRNKSIPFTGGPRRV